MADVAEKSGPSAVAQHILRVAARLFSSRGYDATSVREIVEAAGVTKPTLYYHFGSKEGLAHALLTVPMTGLAERLGRIVDGEGDPIEGLVAYMEAGFEFCREEPDRFRFLYALFFGPLGAELAGQVADHSCEMERLLGRLIERAVEAGQIRADAASRFFAAFRGLIVISTANYLYKGVNLPVGRGHDLVRDLLDGFGGQGRADREERDEVR